MKSEHNCDEQYNDINIKIFDLDIDNNDKIILSTQVTELYESLNNEKRDAICEIKQEMNKMKKEYDNKYDSFQRMLDEKISIIESKNDTIKHMSSIFEGITILRQILNVLLPHLWTKYHDKLEHIDYNNLAEKTVEMQRKYIIDKDNGSKFALSIIHEIDKTIVFPKNICMLYIKLNDKFHPKIIPIKRSKQHIESLQKLLINENTLLTFFGINQDLINTLKEQIDINESVFDRD